MNLQMDGRKADNYSSNAQKIRVITEDWVNNNMFCPYCGNKYVSHFENNRPVADFFCPSCKEEYELKSKGASISNKINDGAYNKISLQIENFVMVPKYFFSPDIIEKRKPLAETARRAGWTGCNILLNRIPNEGRIYIVQNEKEISVKKIMEKVHRTEFLRGSKLETRGWMLDVLNCVNIIEDRDFTLEQMYSFEKMLAGKHPDNHHIKDKIRQQLQMLRDNGIIEFIGRGHYRKIID